jgi:hypothetical protein
VWTDHAIAQNIQENDALGVMFSDVTTITTTVTTVDTVTTATTVTLEIGVSTYNHFKRK